VAIGIALAAMAFGIKIAAEVIDDALRKKRGSEPTRIRTILELDPTLRYLAAKYSPSFRGGRGELSLDPS